MILRDNVAFGEKIKAIRTNLGLTQLEVRNKTGVSTDTLWRIEKGKTIPRFDTLIVLSVVYKKNLLELYSKHRITYGYIYGGTVEKLDDMIVTADFSEIERLIGEVESIFKKESTGIDEILKANLRQFVLFARMIRVQDGLASDEKTIEELAFEALRAAYPDFSLNKIDERSYGYLETRILVTLATYYRQRDEFVTAGRILDRLLEQFDSDKYLSYDMKTLYPILYYNRSYLSHRLDKHDEVVMYCQKGISSINLTGEIKLYPFLLYRLGIAKYYLGKEDYISDLHMSNYFLELSGAYNVIFTHSKLLLEIHGINIYKEK